MSKITMFQTGLRKLAETYTMQGLAKLCGIPRGNLTSYASGRSRPSVDALTALANALPAQERGPLVLSHLLDECPPSARADLIIELREQVGVDPVVAASTDFSLDAMFAALRHLAESRPDVREWLQESLRLIQ